MLAPSFVVVFITGILGVSPYVQSEISIVAVPVAFVIVAFVVTVVVLNL